MPLNARETLFVTEYLRDLSPGPAALRAGYSSRQQGPRLLARDDIQEAIAATFNKRLARVELKADDVLREVLAIATTDTNEIVEHRRTCCRHCWGAEFGYQRTEREMRNAKRTHVKDKAAHELGGRDLVEDFPEFDDSGGTGYNAAREPNPDCPECSGEGVGNVFVKDTRLLSPAARSLYAGVKQTKDGIEVKLHDKSKHVELLMRHLGLLNDKLDVNVKGDLAERLIKGRKRAGS